MPTAAKKPTNDKVAVITRVVDGRFVYVQVKPKKEYALKLDRLILRKPDGSTYPYRGESLSKLGLSEGKKVEIWGMDNPETNLMVVVDTNPALSSVIGSTFSRAVDFLKR